MCIVINNRLHLALKDSMKMNEPANSAALADSEKPVQVSDNVQFPPFPGQEIILYYLIWYY